jgi:hypothetical protein
MLAAFESGVQDLLIIVIIPIAACVDHDRSPTPRRSRR